MSVKRYPDFSTGPLPGATAPTRFVGGTASGAPTTGTFRTGDYVIAQNGAIWICTAGGTPGTWTQVAGGGGSGNLTGVGLSTVYSGDNTPDPTLGAPGDVWISQVPITPSGSLPFAHTHTSFQANDGSATAPTYSFASDPDTGIYLVGANTIGFSSAGVLRTHMIGDSWRFSDGTAAFPSLAFLNDTDTGIYRGMADRLNFATGGVERLVITNDALTSRTIVRSGDGTAALPAFSFDADPDTGLYREVDGRVSISGNGVRVGFFQQGLLHLESHGQSIHIGDLNHGIKGTGGSGNSFGGVTVNGPVVYGYASVGLGTKQSATELLLYVGSGTAFYPQADNAQTLGGSTNRWSTVYAVTGTINTSDEMTKNTIKQTPLGLDFINALAPKRYKFNGGKRMHDGLLADQVLEAAQSVGVDDLAAFIDPAKGAVKPKKSSFSGQEEYKLALEQYEQEKKAPKGLRYSELIAPMIKAIQELTARVVELEGK